LVDALIGLAPGEQRRFPLSLPADYPQEEMRGVTVEADAHILDIRERTLPPLDDALAQRDGSADTLEEMRDRYRERLVEAAAQTDEEHFQSDVLKALRDRVKVDLPAAMVERELDRELASMEVRLAELGLRFDRYLEYTGGSVEKLRAERRPAAADSVRLELALGALAIAEQIEVDELQVEHEVDRIGAGRRLSGQDRRRLHAAAHVDLLRRAAAERACEIAAGGA
jgi:trigger factor